MLPRSGSAAVPDRDNLPLKKREQRWNSPSFQRQQEQQCDAATFKVPYPHRSCAETRPKHASPFHPFPKRVAALHQPWIHAYTPTSLMPQGVSAFRAHQGWTDCRESKAPCLGWERAHYFQHHSHLSPLIDVGQHPSRLRTGSWTGDAFQSVGDWQQLRGRKSNAWWKSDERNGGPYLKRNRKSESLSHAGYLALSTGPRPSTEQLLQTSPKLPSTSSSGHSFTKDSKLSSAHVSAREEASGFPSPYSPSPNRLPWLLPHFLAGSLIELRDGQLRRVEHLQTEDFLLGALACPDLRLSRCTVQSITPSASSSISRLLILLHDQQSQVRCLNCIFVILVVPLNHSPLSHLISKLNLYPGVGGRLRGVPFFCPGPGLVLLQPSEDGPPLRPSVPPAERRGRVPGSHPALSPTATPAS